MICESFEAVALVELRSRVIDGMHDYELDADLFGHANARTKRVKKKRFSETLPLYGAAACKPSDQHAGDGVLLRCGERKRELFPNQAVGRLGVVPVDPAARVLE